MIELRDLRTLFELQDQGEEIFPKTQLDDYREVMSDVQPRPGFMGLYTAILRKRLTISERLMLDRLYCTMANPIGDLRIMKATILTHLEGTGAS